jgi:transposase
MRFYNNQHKYYCGVDLHARKMFICIVSHEGKVQVHKNIKTDPELFFELLFPFLDDIAVGVDCVFCWYWLADLCAQHHLRFVLGHALYMKAIWRATRDLLRRQMYIARRCGELVAHIQNTNTQYNLPAFRKKLYRKYNHEGVAERFEDPQVRQSVQTDLALIASLNQVLHQLEWHIEKTARQHDFHTLYLLRSIPGVGQILALIILYEIHDIRRFCRVQDFSSYARLIRPVKESDGKWAGHSKWHNLSAIRFETRRCQLSA